MHRPSCLPGDVRAGARSGCRNRILAQQRAPQGVQPDGADVQRLAVESLDVERGALTAPPLVADLLPELLAQLVGRGLARPAKVAGELKVQLALADRNVPAQELVALLRSPGSGSPAFG